MAATVRIKDCPDARDIVAHPEILRGLLYTEQPCPDCGGALTIDTAARKFNGKSSNGCPVRVAFCGGCEFIREF